MPSIYLALSLASLASAVILFLATGLGLVGALVGAIVTLDLLILGYLLALACDRASTYNHN